MKRQFGYGASAHAKRKLVLVDLENACGKPVLDRADVRDAKAAIVNACKLVDGDLVIVATSHTRNFINAKLGWKGVAHVISFGKDGADRALIRAAQTHLPRANTFSEVLIYSGDGIFSEIIRDFSCAGSKTTVVSPAKRLSRTLAFAATTLVLTPAGAHATASAC